MALVEVEVVKNGIPFTFQMEEATARDQGLLKDPVKDEPKKAKK